MYYPTYLGKNSIRDTIRTIFVINEFSMHFIDKIDSPGEHIIRVEGVAGELECVLTIPEVLANPCVAFLGHPHSLQGGTMNNKVVTTLARVFKELGIPSLRFNFRGVGQSSGTYDHGLGESEDMILLVREWQKIRPQDQYIFAGFSFGSYVTYRAALKFPDSLLITIAPPVHHYNYKEFKANFSSWLIVQGDEDEVVPYSLVSDFAQECSPVLPIIKFANTGHFFHGKLVELKSQLIEYVRTQVGSL